MAISIAEHLTSPVYKARRFGRILAVSVALSCLLPRLVFAMLAVSALSALTIAGTRDRLTEALSWRNPAFAASIAVLSYLLINASWSMDRAMAYEKIGLLGIAALAGLICAHAVRCLEEETLRYAQFMVVLGVAMGLAVLAAEVAGERTIARALYNLFPWMRPENTKLLIVTNNYVEMAGLSELNRHMGLLTLLTWPVLLLLDRLSSGWRRVCLAGGFFALVAVTVGGSSHETSQIAVAGSAIVFLLGHWSARRVRIALALLWCAAFLAVMPMATYAYRTAELHKASWLPFTAQSRIIIWAYTAERVAEAPLLGVGIRSTRLLDERNAKTADQPDDHVFARRTGRHAHNIYLQSWYELGFVGVMLAMGCGLMLLLQTARLPESAQAYANATFAAFALLAAFSWGMWQTWLLASWALVVVFVLLASRRATSVDVSPREVP